MYIVSVLTRRPTAPGGALLTCPWLHSSERLMRHTFSLVSSIIHRPQGVRNLLSFESQPMRTPHIDSASAEACCFEGFIGRLYSTFIFCRNPAQEDASLAHILVCLIDVAVGRDCHLISSWCLSSLSPILSTSLVLSHHGCTQRPPYQHSGR